MPEKDYLTIDDFNLSGKTILCRLDLNSPMSPGNEILDDKRFKGSLSTLNELDDSKLVLMSHLRTTQHINTFAATNITTAA